MTQAFADPVLIPLQAGGGIIRLSHLPTHFDDWNRAIEAGAPETKPDSSARDMWKLYPPIPPMQEPQRYILMWAGAKSVASTHAAQCWGRQYQLIETDPYEIFALSASFPCLYERFGMRGGGLVPTRSVPFKTEAFICGLWQSQSGERRATMVNRLMKFHDRTIFIFREA